MSGLLDRFGAARIDAFFGALPRTEGLAIKQRLAWRRRQARPEQLPPPRDHAWRVWMLLGGRGSGKTRPAAEWAWWESWSDPGSITHVVARRDVDHKTTTFGGPSGLLSVIPYELIEKKTEGPWSITLKHPTSSAPGLGSKILGFTAAEPGTLRGPQSHRTWADEIAGYEKLDDAWAQIQLSTRLKSHRNRTARIVVSTTPKPKPIIANLVKRAEQEAMKVKHGLLDAELTTVIVNRYSTYANAANLDENTLAEYDRIYGKTKLGRQELYAELIDPSEAGIVKKSQIKLWPNGKPLPRFDYVFASMDTGYEEKDLDDETGDPDPTACQVWGVFTEYAKPKPPKVNLLLLYAWAEQLPFNELLIRAKDELKHKYGRVETPIIKPLFGPNFLEEDAGKPIDFFLIENKVSGISLRQMLAAEGLPVLGFNPGNRSKLLRLHLVSHLFPHGHVWMPESERNPGDFADYANEVIEQLTTFAGDGTIAHDDHVDAAVQALHRVFLTDVGTVTDGEERQKQIEREIEAVLKPVENPYAQ